MAFGTLKRKRSGRDESGLSKRLKNLSFNFKSKVPTGTNPLNEDGGNHPSTPAESRPDYRNAKLTAHLCPNFSPPSRTRDKSSTLTTKQLIIDAWLARAREMQLSDEALRLDCESVIIMQLPLEPKEGATELVRVKAGDTFKRHGTNRSRLRRLLSLKQGKLWRQFWS